MHRTKSYGLRYLLLGNGDDGTRRIDHQQKKGSSYYHPIILLLSCVLLILINCSTLESSLITTNNQGGVSTIHTAQEEVSFQSAFQALNFNSSFTYLGRISTLDFLSGVMKKYSMERSNALEYISNYYISIRLPARFEKLTNSNDRVERIEVLVINREKKEFYLMVNSYNVESYFLGKNTTLGKITPLFTDLISPYFPTAFDGKTFVMIFKPNGWANILKQSDDNSTSSRTILHTPQLKMFNPTSNLRNQFKIVNVMGKNASQVINVDSGKCLTFNDNGYFNNLIADFQDCDASNTNQLYVWTGTTLVSLFSRGGSQYYALKRDFAFGTSFMEYSSDFKYITLTLQLVTSANYDVVRSQNISLTDSSIEQFYSGYSLVLDEQLDTTLKTFISQAVFANNDENRYLKVISTRWSSAPSSFNALVYCVLALCLIISLTVS